MLRRDMPGFDRPISVVGFGAFAAGGWMWGGQNDADTVAAICAAVEVGVDWIDTAPIYGSGKADAAIAMALRQLPPSRRPRVFTKFGHHLVDGQRVSDGSTATVVRDCEAELARLGVERLDLFQLHWPTPTPIAETAAACAELLEAGKIAAIGVSNFTVAQLDAWAATGVPLHSVQNPFSLLQTKGALAPVAPQGAPGGVLDWCVAHGVAFLAYSPLMRGLLSGTWTAEKTFPPGDHRGERDEYRPPRLLRHLALVDELRAIAAEDELSVPQVAIGWLLCHEGVTAVIVGARSAAQGMALGELGLPLRATQVAAIDAALTRWASSASS